MKQQVRSRSPFAVACRPQGVVRPFADRTLPFIRAVVCPRGSRPVRPPAGRVAAGHIEGPHWVWAPLFAVHSRRRPPAASFLRHAPSSAVPSLPSSLPRRPAAVVLRFGSVRSGSPFNSNAMAGFSFNHFWACYRRKRYIDDLKSMLVSVWSMDICVEYSLGLESEL